MDFETAFRKVIVLEGGFVLHKNKTEDAETYAGIYRKAHPNWKGWAYIDRGISPPTSEVRNFYKKEFWDKIDLPDSEAKYIIFEYGVNAGLSKAIKIAQAVVGEVVDGVIGNKTKSAIAKVDPEKFVMMYTLARIKHYVDLSANNKYRIYLRGWINRALEAL